MSAHMRRGKVAGAGQARSLVVTAGRRLGRARKSTTNLLGLEADNRRGHGGEVDQVRSNIRHILINFVPLRLARESGAANQWSRGLNRSPANCPQGWGGRTRPTPSLPKPDAPVTATMKEGS